VDEVGAVVLVEMDGDLAVGAGAKFVPPRAELLSNRPVAVELPVHHDAHAAIFVGDGLVSIDEADDGQPHVAQCHATVGRLPGAFRVGPAVRDALERRVELRPFEAGLRELGGDESTHGDSFLWNTRLADVSGRPH
jgi:hypothetical protein